METSACDVLLVTMVTGALTAKCFISFRWENVIFQPGLKDLTDTAIQIPQMQHHQTQMLTDYKKYIIL